MIMSAVPRFSVLFLLVVLLFWTPYEANARARNRYPDPKLKSKPKPKPPKLNIDLLPPLQEVLEKLDMMKYIKNLIKMGVTETRLLVRLTDMDFRMMSIEWDGVTDDEVQKLKSEVSSLYNQAVVVEEDTSNPEIDERKKLKYGRVYIDNTVQSFEYLLASFGGSPSTGKLRLLIAPDIFGCNLTTTSAGGGENTPLDLSGTLLVALRGNCTFLSKAINARESNASALVIVNTEDRLESPSSGQGIDKNITDAIVQQVGDLPVLAFSNTSWAKIQTAVEFSPTQPIYAHIVPLKCKSGGTCQPVLAEERALQPEVSWGTMRLRDGQSGEVRSFEFVSSNFGSTLPVGTAVPIVLARPDEGCDALQAPGTPAASLDEYAGAAVVVNRGKCRFDAKALVAQQHGARMVIIVDVDDNALQRVGGMAPESGYVGIPSVLVTAPTGEYIRRHATGQLQVEFVPAEDSSGADNWIDVAFTTWSEGEDERLIQLEGLVQKYAQSQSKEIVAWLHRRIDELTAPVKKNMDTDEF